MNILYSIIEQSPLGPLLVATTERGLCMVRFGDSVLELTRAVRQDLPTAQRDETRLRPWITALQEYFNGDKLILALPLDVPGTAFQQRVWNELQKIPYGQTRSYSEIAKTIGHPKAARAVARACAANPVPIVIPCHRVIRADGSLGGYSGGLARKRALLSLEGAQRLKSVL
ncbi:MAG: methylated-DNA--[protein]-cysteine S-methyltransferase [Candidatus Bipolaricaulota bacterium]|nr:methylated-DNA--[protein]-cysteine S-methyltransferase [Candidatus Bipolaricaulota bacterium]